jgi:hypothetical protein
VGKEETGKGMQKKGGKEIKGIERDKEKKWGGGGGKGLCSESNSSPLNFNWFSTLDSFV